MAKLVYSTIMSLDACVEDADGDFGWAAPDEEVFAFVNEIERPIGTYLYGRRMYETMAGWEDMTVDTDLLPVTRDFATIWRAAGKVVYSSTLPSVWTARTRLERSFDPQTVRQMKADAGRDLSVGGPELAAQAFRAGIVDECHCFVVPIVVGSGKRALPAADRVALELVDSHTFSAGAVHLHYAVRQQAT